MQSHNKRIPGEYTSPRWLKTAPKTLYKKVQSSDLHLFALRQPIISFIQLSTHCFKNKNDHGILHRKCLLSHDLQRSVNNITEENGSGFYWVGVSECSGGETQAGAVAILHTWGQTLVYHPHIHMIVPAGGLSEDQMEWIPSAKKFFLPVKALSKVFRGILCKLLERALSNGQIKLPEESDFKAIIHQCYKKPWVVYCEKPFGNADRLIDDLGSYTHRVAIANNRIIDHSENEVRFNYKDYRSGGICKQVSLKAEEFIRRFLQHVLPDGFYKIRYFGFMAMCNMQSKLATCYELIGNNTFLPVLQGLNAAEVWRSITGQDLLRCPKCKTGMMRKQADLTTALLNPG